jgi:threonine/homoserine/homoserine lactone efflux protein
MAYLAILSASDGKRAGFAAIIGIALGLFIVGIASALGVAALISSSKIIYETLRWCGVFYLLWLAWDGWNTSKETSPEQTNGKSSDRKFFRRGLITNLLNPKAVLFYVAILPSFVTDVSSVFYQTVLLTIIYVTIATLIHSTIVLLADYAHKVFNKPRQILFIRRSLSLLLIAVALWFAVSTAGVKS